MGADQLFAQPSIPELHGLAREFLLVNGIYSAWRGFNAKDVVSPIGGNYHDFSDLA